MAVTYSAKGGFASGTGALTIGVPTGYAAGDLLLICAESANQVFTTPSGWTALSTAGTGTGGTAGAVRIGCFWKIAGASEASVAFTDTGDHTTAVMLLFKGNNLTNPIIQATSTTAAANTAVTFHALNISKAGTMVVYVVATDRDASSTTNFSAWTNSQLVSVTEAVDQTHTSGFGGGLGIAYGICANVRSLQAGTCTDATSVAHAMSSIGIQPPFGTDVPVMTAATGITTAGNKGGTKAIGAISAATGMNTGATKHGTVGLNAFSATGNMSASLSKAVAKVLSDISAVSNFALVGARLRTVALNPFTCTGDLSIGGSGGGETISKYGYVTNVYAYSDLAAASNANYAIFAGGRNASNYAVNGMFAYDNTLTRSTGTLADWQDGLGAASVGDYALFAGGNQGTPSFYYTSAVSAFNLSLTRSTPTVITDARQDLAGASVGNYALFAGGANGSGNRTTVNAYDTSLTRSTPTALSIVSQIPQGRRIGNYALFRLGTGASNNAFDTSLTRTTPSDLPQAMWGAGMARAGNYLLLVGGFAGATQPQKYVYSYDESLTRGTPTELPLFHAGMMGTEAGTYGVFGGGSRNQYPSETITNIVYAYDSSLTRTTLDSLNEARRDGAAASVGGYAIIASGVKSVGNSSNADIYQYSSGSAAGGVKGGQETLDDLTATTGIATAAKKQANGTPTFTGVGDLSVVWAKGTTIELNPISAATGLQFVSGKLVYKDIGAISAVTGIETNGKKDTSRILGSISAVGGLTFNNRKNTTRILGTIGTAATGINTAGNKQTSKAIGSIAAASGIDQAGRKGASKTLDPMTAGTGITFNNKKNASRVLGTIGTAATNITQVGKKGAAKSLDAINASSSFTTSGIKKANQALNAFTSVTGIIFAGVAQIGEGITGSFAISGTASFGVAGKKGAIQTFVLSGNTGLAFNLTKNASKALGVIGSAATGISQAGKKNASQAIGTIEAATGINQAGKKGATKSIDINASSGIGTNGRKNASQEMVLSAVANLNAALSKNANAPLGTITAVGQINVSISTQRFSADLVFDAQTGIMVSGVVVAGGKFQVWNGSEWVLCPAKVWDGNTWVEKIVKVWNGADWA